MGTEERGFLEETEAAEGLDHGFLGADAEQVEDVVDSCADGWGDGVVVGDELVAEGELVGVVANLEIHEIIMEMIG